MMNAVSIKEKKRRKDRKEGGRKGEGEGGREWGRTGRQADPISAILDELRENNTACRC